MSRILDDAKWQKEVARLQRDDVYHVAAELWLTVQRSGEVCVRTALELISDPRPKKYVINAVTKAEDDETRNFKEKYVREKIALVCRIRKGGDSPGRTGYDGNGADGDRDGAYDEVDVVELKRELEQKVQELEHLRMSVFRAEQQCSNIERSVSALEAQKKKLEQDLRLRNESLQDRDILIEDMRGRLAISDNRKFSDDQNARQGGEALQVAYDKIGDLEQELQEVEQECERYKGEAKESEERYKMEGDRDMEEQQRSRAMILGGRNEDEGGGNTARGVVTAQKKKDMEDEIAWLKAELSTKMSQPCSKCEENARRMEEIERDNKKQPREEAHEEKQHLQDVGASDRAAVAGGDASRGVKPGAAAGGGLASPDGVDHELMREAYMEMQRRGGLPFLVSKLGELEELQTTFHAAKRQIEKRELQHKKEVCEKEETIVKLTTRNHKLATALGELQLKIQELQDLASKRGYGSEVGQLIKEAGMNKLVSQVGKKVWDRLYDDFFERAMKLAMLQDRFRKLRTSLLNPQATLPGNTVDEKISALTTTCPPRPFENQLPALPDRVTSSPKPMRSLSPHRAQSSASTTYDRPFALLGGQMASRGGVIMSSQLINVLNDSNSLPEIGFDMSISQMKRKYQRKPSEKKR